MKLKLLNRRLSPGKLSNIFNGKWRNGISDKCQAIVNQVSIWGGEKKKVVRYFEMKPLVLRLQLQL